MIHYYTNREISEKLKINLARWKRWSRAFLPPDPLGGLQSGYTRQYSFKDLFKVYLGGHLLSHLRLSLPESVLVLSDLSPWLNKNGFFDLKSPQLATSTGSAKGYRIYFFRSQASGSKTGSGFGYLIRHLVRIEDRPSPARRQVTETLAETIFNSDAPDADAFFKNPHIYLINLSALFAQLLEALHPSSP